MNPRISVVTPIYRCRECLAELCQRLAQAIEPISPNFEIILVNDASPDGAWETIVELAKTDSRIKGINLSRNFGQHYAITAGLDFAFGDWVVVMDCDLQHRPEDIPKLFDKTKEGYDLVVGTRAERKDTWLKRMGSWLFYKAFALLSRTKATHKLSNFGIYSQKVVRGIRSLREQGRAFGFLALWVGFKRAEIELEHAKRPYGESAYDLTRLVCLALDSILSYSVIPLFLVVNVGLCLSLLAFVYGIWIIVRYMLWASPIEGWSSLIVSISFTSGLILGSIGIVGLYVGKIYDEVKKRPLYIIDALTFDIGSEAATEPKCHIPARIPQSPEMG